jgi:hypothetical protein
LAQRYRALTVLTPFLGNISHLSYLCHVAGLLTSLPSFTSGTAELWELYKNGGINRMDKELTHPRSHEDLIDRSIKIGIAHGALNFVAAGVSTYAALSRRKVPSFAPGRASILLSVLMLPGVALSAALGGELVYGKGIGVQRMGNALDEKKQGLKESASKAA